MKSTKKNTHIVQTVVCNIRSYRKNDNGTREAALAQRGELYLIHPLAITFPSKEDSNYFYEKQQRKMYSIAVLGWGFFVTKENVDSKMNKKLPVGEHNCHDGKPRTKPWSLSQMYFKTEL